MAPFYETLDFRELLAVCADAPSPAHRSEATRLLATELVARLEATDRDYSLDNPIWEDRKSPPAGGPEIAAGYRMAGKAYVRPGHGTVPRVPRTDYAQRLAAIQSDIAKLLAVAPPTMSNGLFAAARDEALARLRIDESTPMDPGERFSIGERVTLPTGYLKNMQESEVPGVLVGKTLTVPASGNYRVNLSCRLSSKSTTANTDVKLALAVNGTPVETYTVVRASADPEKHVHFNTSDEIAIDGPLSLVNASGSHVQRAVGLMRVWRV